MTRPPIIHLAGGSVPCCGGWILMDCDGVYKCPCGKRHDARAMKIVRAMNLDETDENRKEKDQSPHA